MCGWSASDRLMPASELKLESKGLPPPLSPSSPSSPEPPEPLVRVDDAAADVLVLDGESEITVVMEEFAERDVPFDVGEDALVPVDPVRVDEEAPEVVPDPWAEDTDNVAVSAAVVMGGAELTAAVVGVVATAGLGLQRKLTMFPWKSWPIKEFASACSLRQACCTNPCTSCNADSQSLEQEPDAPSPGKSLRSQLLTGVP